MNEVFWRNIIPQINTWKEHAKDGVETEQAILRYTLTHLQDLLDARSDTYIPEEMYLAPPVSEGVKTGSIVCSKNDGKDYIVLSPACDLVMRSNGQFKTDKIVICGIEKFSIVRDTVIATIKGNKRKEKLKEILKNNYANYYHWLPKTKYYNGGFVNFRWLSSFDPKKFKELFEEPKVQVSPSFIKDVISRFSSYYARQGQPDFDFDSISSKAIDHVDKT